MQTPSTQFIQLGSLQGLTQSVDEYGQLHLDPSIILFIEQTSHIS